MLAMYITFLSTFVKWKPDPQMVTVGKGTFYKICNQGGKTWQPFVGGKIDHENFCQARIYNFRDKCVVFARNRKFAYLTY